MNSKPVSTPRAQPRTPKAGFASRLFGYDIFLSFALGPPPRGTHSYASDLARRLRERDYSVFFSEDEAAPGEQLDSTLRGALHRSRALVVIANRGTLAEPRWVRKEVEEFRQHHPGRPVIAINAGAALQDPALADDAQGWLGHQGKIWLDETEDAVAAGIASDALVSRLATAPARAKSNVRWRWLVRAATASLAALAIGAGYAAWQAKLNAEEANRQRTIALGNLQRALTGEKQATDNALRATHEASRAQKAEVEALGQKGRAEQEAARARQAEILAKQESERALRQSRIALARQLAAQSSLILNQNPERLPLATLLALESARLHPSFETSQALRSTLTLLPRVEWASGHTSAPGRGRVRALAFSPDGSRLAAAREDGSAELVDVNGRKTVALLQHDAEPGVIHDLPGGGIKWKAPGVDAEVVAVAFSADGKLLATASNDHSARVWDAGKGKARFVLPHDSAVSSVAFHPRRPWLATGSRDGSVRFWNVRDGSLHEEMKLHGNEVRAVAFSPDGRYFASIGDCARLIDLDKPEHEFDLCTGSAGMGLAFSADGRRIAIAGGSHAGVFDTANGELLFKVTHLPARDDAFPEHFKWISRVAFSPDGKFLATAGRDGTARIWNTANGQEAFRFSHGASVESVAFSPDGLRLATASMDETARLWDLTSGKEQVRAAHDGWAEAVSFSPRGGLLASGSSDGSLMLWQSSSGDHPLQITHALSIKGVGFDKDGKRISTIDDKNTVRVWSAQGDLIHDKQAAFGAKRTVFSHDGRYLAVLATNPRVSLIDLGASMTIVPLDRAREADEAVIGPHFLAARDRERRRLLVWKTAGGEKLSVPFEDDPWKLSLDGTSKYLASLHQDKYGKGYIRVLSLESMSRMGQVPFDTQPEFAISPGGKRLAMTEVTRAADRTVVRRHVSIYKVSNARVQARIDENRPLSLLLFSPDGGALFTVGESASGQANEIRVWNAVTGALITRLQHVKDVDTIRLSATGSLIATKSGGAISIWNYMNGELLGQISAEAGFSDFRFSPDGRHILTGDGHGNAVMWRWGQDDLRNDACGRLGRNMTRKEWTRYVGAIPYHSTCPDLPLRAAR